jgi:hypothetical protein
MDMHRFVKRIALLTVVASLFAVAGNLGAGAANAMANRVVSCGGYTGADGDWHIKCYVL